MSLEERVRTTMLHLREVVTVHQPATFASSFGMEDMVILDMLAKLDLEVEMFTLDTGRLHEETYKLIERAQEKYGHPLRVFYPERNALESFVIEHGINAFFKSIDLRKGCCAIRKVEPLRRALQGKKLWITGLRRQQSVTRENLDLLLFDGDNGLFKLNPLFDWSAKEVSEYVRVQDVPVNELHAQGYPSVGCAPCTRAVQQGEDERAGRWWWEQAESRECGLHMDPDGRLVRAVSRLAPESKQLTKGRSQ